MKHTWIEARNLFFTYPGETTKVLDSVSFSISEGEVVLLTGLSGSGKSTLLNLINGLIPEIIEGHLEGNVFIDGKENLKIYERSLILGNVFQNPRSQFFTTNSTAELVFAMENYGVPLTEMKQRLFKLTQTLHIESLLDRDIFCISSGQRQLLALLTVLILDPKVVVFDEPSANLDYGNALRLRKQIQRLKADGKTVIVADHRCFYLQGILDRVLLVKDRKIHEFHGENDFLMTSYAKRQFDLFAQHYESRPICYSKKQTVCLRNVDFKRVLKGVHMTLYESEVTALLGINGAGKTTMARLISGLLKPTRGKIENKAPVLYIMQDADFQLFGSSCLKELEITNSDQGVNEQALVDLQLGNLKDKHPQMLSGGQKQRLQMAISKVCSNKVIILDEPTSGLDAQSMQIVASLIRELRKDRTILLISHDYEFLRMAADKVVYLKDGCIQDEFYLEKNQISRLNGIYKEMERYYEE